MRSLGNLMYYLSQYQFKIIYSQGNDNIEADSLSRNAVLDSFENEEDMLKVVNLITLETIVEDQLNHEATIRNSKKVIQEGNISYNLLNNRKRIFISQELGQELIETVHKFYGHIGADHLPLLFFSLCFCTHNICHFSTS